MKHRPMSLATAGALLLLAPAVPAPAGQRCAGLIVSAPAPGQRSVLLEVVVGESSADNSSPVAHPEQTVNAMSLAVGAEGEIYASDPEADPTGFGADPLGGRGRGGVFLLDAPGGEFTLVSDGSSCDDSITHCGAEGVFVDPLGLAFTDRGGSLVIVDPSADPSGLGPDRSGLAGHGAVFSTVCRTSGELHLIADGSNVPAGLPEGRRSIFEQPFAAAFGREGTLYVADRAAQLDPHGGIGAIFRVSPRGEVSLVAAESDFRSLRDLSVGPDGHLLVLDGADAGRIFEIDPQLPVGENTLERSTCSSLVNPVALAVAGNGQTYVLDSSADPLGLGATGAIFLLEGGQLTTVVSSTLDFAGPRALALVSPVSLDEATPAEASPGMMLTVTLSGGPFDDSSEPDFGEGIEVFETRVLTRTSLEADLVVGAGVTPGLRRVSVRDERNTEAFHCDLFEVSGGSFCATTAPVAASLRVGIVDVESGGLLRLAWDSPADPCLDTFAAYRSFTPIPSGGGGSWPVDPWFIDMRPAELDGSLRDPRATFHPVHGRNEFFLVVPVGTNGELGLLGHY